jgi:hypothetical protein
MDNQKFSIGDIVIAEYGKKPFKLTYVPSNPSRWNPYKGVYLHNEKPANFERVKFYEGDPQSEKTEKMKTLYSYIDESGKEVFATHLATNSNNQYVLEKKGTGEVIVKDPEELTEVVPYTISVEVMRGVQSYISKPGQVKKGDTLLHTGGSNGGITLAVVKDVDTKDRSATKKFPGVKLLTEPLD